VARVKAGGRLGPGEPAHAQQTLQPHHPSPLSPAAGLASLALLVHGSKGHFSA